MATTQALKLVLLEASKTKNQHSTVVDGVLLAHRRFAEANASPPPTLYAHRSLYERLSPEAQERADFKPIPVMDPEKRRLIRKSLLEAAVVLWAMIRLNRKSELLLITTLLPSSSVLVEILKWFFPSKRVVVMVHGEIEGALDATKCGLGSYGFYVNCWFAIRRFYSRLDLAVIDNFIATGLLSRFPRAVRDESLYVLPLLIRQKAELVNPQGPAACCFIGYDTPNKGFSSFVALSAQFPGIVFRAIGDGVVRNVQTGSEEPITGNDDFIEKIAACDIAIFPYTGGYNLSLSAAATDAISAGTHLIATERRCFVALQEEFGSHCVTICQDTVSIEQLLADKEWLKLIRIGRGSRLSSLAKSRYDIAGVSVAMGNLLSRRFFQKPQLGGEAAVL